MPSDDHPITALRNQFELEDSSRTPIMKKALEMASRVRLGWPLDKAVELIKDQVAADADERIKIMLETCGNALLKHDEEINNLRQSLSSLESQQRAYTAKELLIDAARKAFNTRAIDRVKRVGLILANGMIDLKPTDADEIEEMMRVATELGDNDVRYLRELVRIEGTLLANYGRVERYSAHTIWEQGFWGTGLDNELDSVFSKLESYGLVARVPPPNNLNVLSDFQNRYVLLKKGLRFVNLTQKTSG